LQKIKIKIEMVIQVPGFIKNPTPAYETVTDSDLLYYQEKYGNIIATCVPLVY
jgi:hypothetical protein